MKLCGMMPASLYHHIIDNAKKRAIQVSRDLSRPFLHELLTKQQHRCALSGMPIWFANSTGEHMRGGTSASLDRINSRCGYERSNVQWVHKEINRMKGGLTEQEFVAFCTAIAQHKGGTNLSQKFIARQGDREEFRSWPEVVGAACQVVTAAAAVVSAAGTAAGGAAALVAVCKTSPAATQSPPPPEQKQA
jgi:hypothetical protein